MALPRSARTARQPLTPSSWTMMLSNEMDMWAIFALWCRWSRPFTQSAMMRRMSCIGMRMDMVRPSVTRRSRSPPL